jgi:hypothetical protein
VTRLRDAIGLSERAQRRLTWAMEIGLLCILVIGIWFGRTGVLVNAGLALLVTQLPPLLERDYGISLDVGLTLWITLAVFLHAVGTVPLPAGIVDLVGSVPADATAATLYTSGSWWDHLTHSLSATVVAGVGYTVVRALDEHSDAVSFPPKFVFVYILLFVVAAGVLWEVVEFLVGEVARLAATEGILVQYGVEDTMLDLVFNLIGGVIVSLWGGAYLTGLVEALAPRFGASE